MSKPDKPSDPRNRNSLPSLLTRLQAWMESAQLLHKILPIEPDVPVLVLRVRRNFKFRKITVEAGGDRYICYTHYWPRGLRNLVWFSEQATRANVSVPQPLRAHTAWRDLLADRAFTLVLPYVEGEPLGSQTPDSALRTLGHSLGRLHGITSRNWGPLLTNFPAAGLRGLGYWPDLQKYWRRSAGQLQHHAPFTSHSEIEQSLEWLRRHGQFLKDLNEFNLTHGDPAGGNFLLTTTGDICLIDCDRIGFAPGPMELANALLQNYCANNRQRRLILTQSYLETCPPQLRSLWEQHALFFTAAALLWRTQRKLQWAIKRPDQGRSLQRAEQAWRQLQMVIKARPSDWQSDIALLDD